MNLLKWLILGTSLVVSLNQPAFIIKDDTVSVSVSATALFTEEMVSLLDHGVPFGVELYVSVIGKRKDGSRFLQKYTEIRSLERAARSDTFLLSGRSGQESFSDVESAEQRMKNFSGISFSIEMEGVESLSFFLELSLSDNPVMEEQFHIKTESFWNYYNPSVKRELIQGEDF